MLSKSGGLSRAASLQPLTTPTQGKPPSWQTRKPLAYLAKWGSGGNVLVALKQSPPSGRRCFRPAAALNSMSYSMDAAAAHRQAAAGPPVVCAPQAGWSHAMMAHYLTTDRNWRAVEDYYIRLVSGTACLSQIGLAPAGAAAAEQPAAMKAVTEPIQAGVGFQSAPAIEQVSLQQQQQVVEPSSHQQTDRRTYKVHVSYLGGSFAGWARQPGRLSVEETLAAAVAAAGLTGESPDDHNAKRAAARAARRQQKRARRTAGNTATDGACTKPAVAGAAAAGGTAQREMISNSTSAENRTAAAGDVAAASVGPRSAVGVDSAAAAAASNSTSARGAVRLPAISVAGRTDAGVTAVGQMMSFHSRLPPMPPQQLLQQLNTALAGVLNGEAAAHNSSGSDSKPDVPNSKSSYPSAGESSPQPQAALTLPTGSQIRAWAACEEPRQFHATFSATWRRYVYLLPFRQQQQQQPVSNCQQGPAAMASSKVLPQYSSDIVQATRDAVISNQEQLAVQQAPDVDPERVNALLQHLQGRKLDYYSYARDTPKGKDCRCMLHTTVASVVHLPLYATPDEADHQVAGVNMGHGSSSAAVQPCLCIELVGDRFLRRMVRVLAATAVRESLVEAAAVSDQCDADGPAVQPLVQLAMLADRNVTAAAAPALGLCFASAGYDC